LRCGCGALLAGVDICSAGEDERPAAAESARDEQQSVAATRLREAPITASSRSGVPSPATGAPAAVTLTCPYPDCGQSNPAGSERCLYCNRPVRLRAASLLWPWGERMAVGRELHVGREAPAPQSLIDRLQREFDNVSRRHAVLRWLDDGLWVEDLDSLNGTFINEVRLPAGQPIRVHDGASLRFAADLVVTVHVGDA
jgi:hypothetical protein